MWLLDELLRSLEVPHEVLGAGSLSFSDIRPIGDASTDSLAFLNAPSAESIELIRNSRSSLILIERIWGRSSTQVLVALNKTFVLLDHPRLQIARILKKMYPHAGRKFVGVHPTAVIDPGAKIHRSVVVGPFAIVGKCNIGADSYVGAFTMILDEVTIGERVTIRDHCTVGSDGFGFARDEQQLLVWLPHIGTVRIEDDVDLFPYVNVDRATLGVTTIRRGAKVDHYCHVGHNSDVGEDSVITAGVVLCGGSHVGPRAWVGVGAIVQNNVHVGADAIVGSGAVVNGNVAPGLTVAGVPARVLERRTRVAGQ